MILLIFIKVILNGFFYNQIVKYSYIILGSDYMDNLRVVVDAGHGGTDSGAVGGNVKEKDLTLEIAKYMTEEFQKKGVPVTLRECKKFCVNGLTMI